MEGTGRHINGVWRVVDVSMRWRGSGDAIPCVDSAGWRPYTPLVAPLSCLRAMACHALLSRYHPINIIRVVRGRASEEEAP
jgi:hypothetical protein